MRVFYYVKLLFIIIVILSSCDKRSEKKTNNKTFKVNETTKNDSVNLKSEKVKMVFEDTIFVKYRDPFSDSLFYKEDTIIKTSMHNVFLAGTDVLPSTHNQLSARKFNIFIDNITSSDCVHDVEEFSNEIVSVTNKDDKVIVKTNVQSNCCYQFLGDIGVANDSILNLIYIDYGDNHCACNCIFNLTFFLSTNQYNEDGIVGLKGFVINNDFSTLKSF